MKATLFLSNKETPVAELDEVTVVALNDNHKQDPVRIAYKSHKLNSIKTTSELYRVE